MNPGQSAMSLVVYKLGGSLFELDDLRRRLDEFWSQRPPDEVKLIVAGGGRAADLVRDWDSRFGLGEWTAHDLAVASLRLSEALVHFLIPGSARVRVAEAAALAPETPGVVCVKTLLEEAEQNGIAVPKCWNFTSDSIAAMCARQAGAAELILLKSADPPASASVLDLMHSGGLDPVFDRWSAGIPRIGWVNLRRSPAVRRLQGPVETACD